MTINENVNQLKAKHKKRSNLQDIRAVVGNPITGVMFDPVLNPGKVLVKKQISNGLGPDLWVNAPRSGIGLQTGLNVFLSYDSYGQLYISGVDTNSEVAAGNNPLQATQPAPQSSQQATFETLRVVASNPPGLTVDIKAWQPIVSGTLSQFPGVIGFDISGSMPSAGSMAVLVIAIQNDYATIEVQSSTPRGIADVPLSDADTAVALALLTAGDTPIWAIPVDGSLTAITQNIISTGAIYAPNLTMDLRQMINIAVSGGGSGNVVGPSGATADDIVTYNGTTGLIIKDSGKAFTTDGTLAGNSDALVPTEKAVKTYVDTVAQGLTPKASVLVWTNAALPTNVYNNASSGVGATLTAVGTGVLTVDGVAVPLGARVGVKDEAAQVGNGLYLCTVAGAIGVAYVLTRTTDGDTSADLIGAYAIAEAGTANGTKGYICLNTTTITFNVTAITFGLITSVAAAITQLTGAVTAGPGSGSQVATVVSVGGALAANIAKAAAALADKFILQQADATNLPNAQAMGALATGIVKSTTTTGVQSIAAGSDIASTLGSQTQNEVYASPNGSSGNPSFRALVAADLPPDQTAPWLYATATTTSSTNINISNPGTSSFDSYALSNGDILFLYAQSTLHENGLWVFNGSSSALTRPTNYPSGGTTQAFQGLIIRPVNGSVNGGALWYISSAGAITIDTTSVTFSLLLGNVTGANVLGVLTDYNLPHTLSNHAISGGTINSATIGATIPNTVAATLLSATVTDAATNTVTNVETISHDSIGTPAANFGTGFLVEGQDSTTADQSMARLRAIWTTATHASRAVQAILSAFDSTGERDVISWGANGAAAVLAFFGVTPVVQQANTVALDTAHVNYGLRPSGGNANFDTPVQATLASMVNNTPASSWTLLGGYSSVVSGDYVLGSGVYITIAANARLHII